MKERKQELLRSQGLTEEQIKIADQVHKIHIIRTLIVAVIFILSFGMLALLIFTNIIPKTEDLYLLMAGFSIICSIFSIIYLTHCIIIWFEHGF